MTSDTISARFRERVAAHGLARVEAALDAVALPAIGLLAEVMEQSTLPLGCSKMGGQPDLAPGTVWPVWNGAPLAFLAQLDLAEVARYDNEHALPPSGMLSFFYEAEAQPWGYEASDRGAWRVIFQDVEAGGLVRYALPAAMPPFSRLASQSLRFDAYMTLPDDMRQERIGLVDSEERAYFELFQQTNPLAHQLLGHPHPIQGAMQGDCAIHSAPGAPLAFHSAADRTVFERAAEDEWRLLLQLDSIRVENAPPGREDYWYREWGLGFLIYFWIRNDALAARDFSNVWLQLQTT